MDTSAAVNFGMGSLLMLNALLACMMFAVALTLRTDDFRRILQSPRAPVVGLLAQFLFLPALTCLAVFLLAIEPQLALGMILVASCPGGNFSNVLTWLARGNAALSVSMTAVSSLAATLLTPLNFAFYGWLNPYTRGYLTEIAMDPWSVLALVGVVLGIPLMLGMFTGARYPLLARRSEKPLRSVTLGIFMVFIVVAFANNLHLFLEQLWLLLGLVVAHNFMALALGYWAAVMMRLPSADRRAVTLEVGMQNAGLGLVIIFTFFPDAGGMMLLVGFWGIWHLISGVVLSQFWARQPQTEAQQPG